MKSLGLALYYATRLHAKYAKKFWRWVIGAYLDRNAHACGGVYSHGYGRFMNVGGLNAGNNIHLNAGAHWVCDGGLTVGDNCHFGPNSMIYTRNHNIRGGALPYDHTNISRPVSIGRNVWVGANVTILPGSQIGEGAIIGAGAVVHGTIPAFAILGAAAPVQIGSRDLEHYQNLDGKGLYGGAGGKLIVSKGTETDGSK